jgi:hypothetical protein
MKLIAAVMLLLASASLAFAQGPTKHSISEVKGKTVAVAAPKQCLLAFREFFNYLQKNEPDIVKDERAQKLFLSDNLRKAFQQKIASFTNGSDDLTSREMGRSLARGIIRQLIRSSPRDVTVIARSSTCFTSGDRTRIIPATNARRLSFTFSKTACGNSTTSTRFAASFRRLKV